MTIGDRPRFLCYGSANPVSGVSHAHDQLFYGIIISLYFYDNERHKSPHIHAKYQGQDASFSILDGSLLSGEIPPGKARLVQAWIEIRREELLADWELAINGEALFPIDPLR